MRAIDLPESPTGHAAPLTHVALRADARRLATASYDGTVIIWDTSTPDDVARLASLKHRRLVNSSAWNPADPGLLATASADKTAAVWHVADDGASSLVTVLARHTDDINSVAWMPDGRRLICVSEDGRATVWDARTGAFLSEIGSHTAHCMMVSVSAQGLVATVGEDGLVSVTAPDDGTPPVTRRYDSSVEGCSWSPDGTALAIARDDGTVELLSRTLEPLTSLQVSRSAARSVEWSDDGHTLIVGAYEGGLHFYDRSGRRLRQIDDARIWPRSVSTAGGLVAAGSFWGAPHLLALDDGRELSAPTTPTYGPNALARRGHQLLVGCDSGAVLALDPDDPRAPAQVHQVTDGPVLALAVRADTFYAGTYDGRVISWAGGPDDGVRAVGEPLGAPVPSLCLDGDVLMAGTYNGELVALDPDTLEVIDRHEAHGGSVKSLVSLDGPGFLSAATDRTVAAGAYADREPLWEHGNLVNAVAQLAGAVVASASRDHTVKVGRLSAGRATGVQTLLGPDESVKCVGLLGTPDCPVVLAGSYDFHLYAWEIDWTDSTATLASGRVVDEFGQGLSCMLPWDGDRVVVAGWDGRIALVGRGGRHTVEVLSSIRLDDLLSMTA
ncbi:MULTISPECIES: WD40 repeat domain-containing protein [unclassified Streptomyces]|uniref:WD40 repeat domain-containing protein n=1 Tax=unclassified Streptomyces TaxID=2593676 RepID=UPI000DD680B1|nr:MULTISPECIES: WD40 repeat domain-containing protein [unclassified Streptomyces]QZZ25365.1 WD40 repeat domain-containing protein [Streptomyces sp. ST1015]